MLKVALTGGIATGKSYVLERFGRLGVPCLDADRLAHGVTAPGTEASQQIAARFGGDLVDNTGTIDRRKLAAIVFTDASARRDLEAIVHPPVRRAIAAGLRAFELTGSPPFAIVDIPLLYEAGRDKDFDRVIATVCSVPHQIERLLKRGMSEEEARQRIAAQWPAEDKARRADFVIQTDGSFEETDAQVDRVLKALSAQATASSPTRPT
jgi:dephospho-CoA kinase